MVREVKGQLGGRGCEARVQQEQGVSVVVGVQQWLQNPCCYSCWWQQIVTVWVAGHNLSTRCVGSRKLSEWSLP